MFVGWFDEAVVLSQVAAVAVVPVVFVAAAVVLPVVHDVPIAVG